MNTKSAQLWLPRDKWSLVAKRWEWYRRYGIQKDSMKFFEPSLWSWPWKQLSNFYILHKALQLMMMYIQSNLVAKRSAVRQIWQKQSYLIKWALTMTLNLKMANQSACMTVWPMMLHHHTKSGYRRYSSWGDNIQMNIHWNSEPFLWPWPWPQQSNQFFFYKTIHLMMMYHQTKFSWKRISSSDNTLKSRILIILSLTVTLTLKMANQSFWKTIWLIVTHHHTNFSNLIGVLSPVSH